jgi:hypothetical protein
VGKGALATCPPSIIGRASRWWARFALLTLRIVAIGELICLAGKRNLDTQLRQKSLVGQITKNLSSPSCKNIPLNSEAKSPA